MTEGDGNHNGPSGAWRRKKARKVVKVAARKAELRDIAPVLMSLPWRKISAGYARVKDINTFIRFYEMYAPLLAEYKDILIEARDSGRYRWFDLHATADGLEVSVIDTRGRRKVLLRVMRNYWDGEFAPTPPTFTPL